MTELNFCPFCSAPQHKVTDFEEKFYFCRECNKFFTLKKIEVSCPKCKSVKVIDSDFPTPDGQLVIQCQSCKKMYAVKDFLSKNKII